MFCFAGHRLCDEPTPLENGYIVGNEFWDGKRITYKCNKGYWLRGPQVRVCNYNETGNWTQGEPICEGRRCFLPMHQEIFYIDGCFKSICFSKDVQRVPNNSLQPYLQLVFFANGKTYLLCNLMSYSIRMLKWTRAALILQDSCSVVFHY